MIACAMTLEAPENDRICAEVVYLLLAGGDKSTQKRDIKRAIAMARDLDKE